MIYPSNKNFVVGADEVGYGCWAGPLVVCGVKAPKDWSLDGLNDSKKLSEKKRDVMTDKLSSLIAKEEISWALEQRSNVEIDKIGLGVALKSCYVEIFKQLYCQQSLIIIDGNLKFDNLGVDDYDKSSVVKADTMIPTVMAASILAKTYRDRRMKQLHNQYPQYDWEHNVGYGVAAHKAAIKKYGFSPLHRMSYNIKL